MDKAFQWLEVSLTVSGELAEAVAEVISRYVSVGVAIETETVFNKEEQEAQPTGNMQVFGYIANDAALEETKHALQEALWHLAFIQPLPEAKFTPIVNQDWMTAWREHYQPVPIGEKLLILPAWMPNPENETRTVVRIDPGQAFGTGTHPSTQLCLLAMEHITPTGQEVIDLGCGSGILAIAAVKFGASRALAVDTDQLSVQATLQNAALNGVLDRIEIRQGSLQEVREQQFSISNAPLVLVNILAPIIMRLLDEGLGDLLSKGGKMVLAGILENQAEEVLSKATAHGLVLQEKLQSEDWVGLILTRRTI